NALKINATLALIGAIVAEFFGTPTQGIGVRISTEAGRMAIDMVWAEIALAALAGMAFYGLVALAERATTFWHPSYRTSVGKVSGLGVVDEIHFCFGCGPDAGPSCERTGR